MNGVNKLITTQEYIWRGPKDSMTRGSRRRTLHLEIRYYILIPGSNYSGMENFEASGKDHSR
jgi:hypothetical protein